MPRGEQIVVSFSELDALRQCPHKHELAYKQRWSPDTVGPALSKGKLWHEVMEVHYRALASGASDRQRLRAVADVLMAADAELADLVGWMYDGYVERWGADPDWEIVSIEDQRLIQLPDRAGRASRFWLRMRADLIVIQTIASIGPEGRRQAARRRMWLVDHKSGRNLPTERELDIDDQFGLYTWGLRKLGEPVFGAIYSAARTQRNVSTPQPLDERFSRTPMHRTDKELGVIAREAYVTAQAGYAWTAGDAPRAPDSDRCRWRCPFTEPCLMGRKSGPRSEQQFLRSGGYTQLDEITQLQQRGYTEPMQPGGPA